MKEFNRNKGMALAIVSGILIFTLLIVFETIVYRTLLTDKKNDLAENYIAIEDRINGVIDTNFSILRGFSAYVQTTDDFTESNVYEFLDRLFEGTDTYIRNIGIIEDTTIIWNYPPESNKAAIGVDLAQVEGQRDRVLKVKNELVTLLDGPVNLVQGGLGYIIRMPLMRNEEYFGQISIVIDGDKFIDFLEETQTDFKVHFKILANGDSIFNEDYVIEDNNLTFVLANNLFTWTIFTRPDSGWSLGSTWFTLVPFVIAVFSILSAFKIYNIYVDNRTNMHNAYHDSLTGLYNRHYLYKYAESIFNIAKINQYNIGIIVIDIDQFKKFNDTYGHKIGDEILINFSKKVKSDLRKGQEIFRIGGDEFIIILENINDRDLLENITNRIKTSIESHILIPNPQIKIKISAGVAMYPDDGANLDILYNIADQNMYIDKDNEPD